MIRYTTIMRGALAVCIASIAMFSYTYHAYTDELFIPPLLEYTMKDNKKSFTLIAKESTHSFSASDTTPTLSYNDMSYLGPTIRLQNNDWVELTVQNTLNAATTLHQHGLHLPAPADGNPLQVIRPQRTWTATYQVQQQAGTYWYHPHRHETTGYQVAMGLSGLIIVDDKESAALNIPGTYGIDDIPLIIQDKRLRNDRVYYSEDLPERMMGNLGNVVATNGAIEPELSATKPLLRFRILNGSSFGVHEYSFDDRRTFYIIANDAGLLEKPLKVKSVLVAPSERRELLVDISDLQANDMLRLRTRVHNNITKTALHIRAAFDTRSTPAIPRNLVQVPALDPDTAVKRRTFVLNSMGGMMMGGSSLTINGRRFNENRVNERVQLNTTEIWVIRSQSMMMGRMLHSFHPHHGSFQVLKYNGRAPPPALRGWKDTVLLFPGDEIEIIMEFTDYTGLYMYHCHQLEHEDAGMMGIFEIASN